jgi:uncharacterized protein
MVGIREDLERKARAVLLGGPPLRLGLLFGSAVKGTLHPESDIDVAILPQDPELSLTAELDLAARLTRALGRTADVVRLDRASTMLRWEVARSGILLVASSPLERIRFQAAAASEHADFAEALRPVLERYRRRLAGEQQRPR